MKITPIIFKKITRGYGERLLGKSVYDLPPDVVLLLGKLQNKFDISLERRFIEELPISDIVTPNILKETNEKNRSTFRDPKDNPIKKKIKKRKYTKPKKVLKPSKHKPLAEWETVGNPNNWKPLHFLGYYFYKYALFYGHEDPLFVGSKWTVTGKVNGKLNNFMLVSKIIESFNEFFEEMGYSGEKVKEYLDYIFDKWLKANPWYTSDITPYKVFGIEKNYLFGQFYKEVLNKKAKKSTWNPMGIIG